MPRPKRTNVALSIPTTRAVEPTSTSTVKQKHATASPSSSGRAMNGSDDSDGLVKTINPGLNRRGVPAQEATMSGALPPEDVVVGGARVKPLTGRKRAALSRVAREADHARAIEALRARRDAAMAAEKGEKVQIPSLMPEKTLIPNVILPNLVKEPDTSTDAVVSGAAEQLMARTGSKAGEPQRAEASTLGASAFKKRPRQPSLLQLIKSQNQDNPPMDFEDDDLNDFRPDDESTSFLKSLSQSDVHQSPLASSSSTQQSSNSRKRKLTSSEIQVPASQPLPARVSSSPQTSDDNLYGVSSENDEPEIAHTSSDLNRPEPTLPSPRTNRTLTPRIWNDTQALPESSSSSPPPQNSDIRNTGSKPISKFNINHKQLSPGPSPASPTSSPSTPAPVFRPLKPLSTATLQNLLPRRRLRSRPKAAAGVFDIPSSDVSTSSDVEIESVTRDEDEDELSCHPTAKSKKKGQERRATTVAKGRKLPTAQSKPQPKTYIRKKHAVDRGDGADNNNRSDRDNGSEALIYGVNNASAKETDAKQRREAKKKLERIAMHFREVDEWELDVEEVTGEGSSQVDAR